MNQHHQDTSASYDEDTFTRAREGLQMAICCILDPARPLLTRKAPSPSPALSIMFPGMGFAVPRDAGAARSASSYAPAARFRPLIQAYGADTFKKIRSAKVLVVGAGGIGQQRDERREREQRCLRALGV